MLVATEGFGKRTMKYSDVYHSSKVPKFASNCVYSLFFNFLIISTHLLDSQKLDFIQNLKNYIC